MKILRTYRRYPDEAALDPGEATAGWWSGVGVPCDLLIGLDSATNRYGDLSEVDRATLFDRLGQVAASPYPTDLEEGRLRHHELLGGSYEDFVIYGVFADAFYERFEGALERRGT